MTSTTITAGGAAMTAAETFCAQICDPEGMPAGPVLRVTDETFARMQADLGGGWTAEEVPEPIDGAGDYVPGTLGIECD